MRLFYALRAQYSFWINRSVSSLVTFYHPRHYTFSKYFNAAWNKKQFYKVWGARSANRSCTICC